MHSAVSLATSVTIQMLNVVSGIMLARLLGPGGKGELAAVLLWPALLATIGGLGLVDALVFFTAGAASNRARSVASTGLWLACLTSAALIVAGFLLMPLVLAHYGPQAVLAGRVQLAWLPPYLVGLGALAIFQGKLDFVAFNLLRLLVIAASVVGLVGLYIFNHVSIVNIVIVYVLAHCLMLIVAISLLTARGFIGLRPEAKLIKPMFVYGLKSHSESVAGIANARADQAMISLFMAPASLGLYSVAVTLTSALGLLGSSLSVVAFPGIASAGSPQDMRRNFAVFVRAAFTLSFLTALVLIPLAPLMLYVFFGAPFVAASGVAQVLILAAVVYGTNRALSAGLKALNQPLAPGLAEGIGVVVTLLALLVLLPLAGLMGAALASILAYTASLLFMIWFAASRMKIAPTSFVPAVADFHWLLYRLGYRQPKS